MISKLDDQQLAIYHYDYQLNNALCIIAGAGSGKTTKIVIRLIFISLLLLKMLPIC